MSDDERFEQAELALEAAGILPRDCVQAEDGVWYCNDSRAATYSEFRLSEKESAAMDVYASMA